MRYKVVSLDIFQTLADVNKRIPQIWQGILKDDYTEEKAMQGAKAIVDTFPVLYEKVVNAENFLTMEELYIECAEEAIGIFYFRASPQDVVYNLMYQHAKAPLYDDVSECVKKLHQKYKIILSSDSSHVMVDGLIHNIDYDAAFISDDEKSYKGDKNGRFFHSVLSRLDAEPSEIIHIGDSIADIYGAQKAGITSCWINRNQRSWNCAHKPDYTIKDLNELVDLL